MKMKYKHYGLWNKQNILFIIIMYQSVKMQSVFEKYLSNTLKYAYQIQMQIFHLVGFQIQIQVQIFAYLNTNTNTYLNPALLVADSMFTFESFIVSGKQMFYVPSNLHFSHNVIRERGWHLCRNGAQYHRHNYHIHSIKIIFPSNGISLITIRRSRDHIFIKENPILMGPCILSFMMAITSLFSWYWRQDRHGRPQHHGHLHLACSTNQGSTTPLWTGHILCVYTLVWGNWIWLTEHPELLFAFWAMCSNQTHLWELVDFVTVSSWCYTRRYSVTKEMLSTTFMKSYHIQRNSMRPHDYKSMIDELNSIC